MLIPRKLLHFLRKITNGGHKLGYFPFQFKTQQQEFHSSRSWRFVFLWALNTIVSFLTSVIFGFLVYVVNQHHRDNKVSTAYWLYYIVCFVLSSLKTCAGIALLRNGEEFLFFLNIAFQGNAQIERKLEVDF